MNDEDEAQDEHHGGDDADDDDDDDEDCDSIVEYHCKAGRNTMTKTMGKTPRSGQPQQEPTAQAPAREFKEVKGRRQLKRIKLLEKEIMKRDKTIQSIEKNEEMIRRQDKEIEDTVKHIDMLETELGRMHSVLGTLEVDCPPPVGQANAFDYDNWQVSSITIDSGASESVCNRSDFPAAVTMPSEGSKTGVKYRAANGDPIPNEGEKQIAFLTEEWSPKNMKFQVCEVTKPLASVANICEKGHRVVFQKGGSHIENLHTGEVTWLRESNGVYLLDVWTPAAGFTRQA